MKKLLFSFLFTFLYGEEKIILHCYQAKTEFVNLNKKVKKTTYSKDSLKLNLIITKNNAYIISKYAKSKLLYLGGYNSLQFIEQTPMNNNILYTLLIKDNILTIQKSYYLLGNPVMVNIYMKCIKK